MTITARPRALASAAAVLALTLAGCSGDADQAPTATPTQATESQSPTQTPTESPEPTDEPTATATETETETQTATTEPTDAGTATATTTATAGPGGVQSADDLAALLPVEFPLPPEIEITGDPVLTPDNASVEFTVPSGQEAFDFFRESLPEAGFELQEGTSLEYSTEVSSGAILARGNGFDINLLVVDNDVELAITRST